MRRFRSVGLCLIAVLAASAVAAASASAGLPEWGGCEATPGGRYEDAACTVKAHSRKKNGNYEWYTGASFGHGYGLEGYVLYLTIGPTTFETTGKNAIACSSGSGETALGPAPNEIRDALLNFEGCKEVGGEERYCSSPEFPHGRGGITNEFDYWDEEEGLGGKLVFVGGKGSEVPTVGLSLTSFRKFKIESKERERLLTAICSGPLGTVWIGGAKKGANEAISLVAPVDQMSTEFTQTFSESSPGVAVPDALENGGEKYLEEFLSNENKWEQSAWTSSFADAAEEGAPAIEIKARP